MSLSQGHLKSSTLSFYQDECPARGALGLEHQERDLGSSTEPDQRRPAGDALAASAYCPPPPCLSPHLPSWVCPGFAH